jgi:hypothetical protein
VFPECILLLLWPLAAGMLLAAELFGIDLFD